MWVMEGGDFVGEVDSWSRAFQFGDGLFETMLIEGGCCKAIKLHAQRLTKGLNALQIPLPEEDLQCMLQSYIGKMLYFSAMHEGVLKVVVSRGDTARGYSFNKNSKPAVTVFFSEKQNYPKECYQQGVALQWVNSLCSVQPQLAGLKHLNRLENVLAKNEVMPPFFEGLMSNYLGDVIEGTMSNIFFEKDSVLYTPDLAVSGVAGVMRRLILDYCQKESILVSIENINQQNIKLYDGAFICNSLMGAMPVKSIEKQELIMTPLIKKIMAAVVSGKIYE
jgi:4-amino-4-deoxychorismate lyase